MLERLLRAVLQPTVDRFIRQKLLAVADTLEIRADCGPIDTEMDRGIQAQARQTISDLRKEATYHEPKSNK